MAIISTRCFSGPEIGERHLHNGKWRVVVGWNHTDDTPEGLEKVKTWAWISSPPEKFQVFDQDFNRSSKAEEVRDCGVANSTMVRMFHPYWSYLGEVPRDGRSADKARCRAKYHALIYRCRLKQGLPVDEDPEEYARRIVAEKTQRKEQRKLKAELRRAQKQAGSDQAALNQKECGDSLTDTLEIVAGGSKDDPMFVESDDDSG